MRNEARIRKELKILKEQLRNTKTLCIDQILRNKIDVLEWVLKNE